MVSHKIYCAGPLFNQKEREDMEEIAQALENEGFDVFLPHRDGLEFAHFLPAMLKENESERVASTVLKKAIFYLDIFHVLESEGIVLNMNGRVPDEGAMVEAGVGWSAGKIIVIFKDDARSLVDGSDNPLVVGLADFRVARTKEEIPKCFRKLFSSKVNSDHNIDFDHLKHVCKIGRKIYDITRNGSSQQELCQDLIKILGGNNVMQVA